MKTLNERRLEAKNREIEKAKHAFGLLDPEYRKEFYKKLIEEDKFTDYLIELERKEILKGKIGKGKQFENKEEYEKSIFDFIGKTDAGMREPKGNETEIREVSGSDNTDSRRILQNEQGGEESS